MRYDLKTVYNPLSEDFIFNWDSEEYVIKAKDIGLFPIFLADHAVKQLVNQLLWNKNKEIDDLSRPKVMEEVLSHTEYEIVDLTGKKKDKVKDDEKEEE